VSCQKGEGEESKRDSSDDAMNEEGGQEDESDYDGGRAISVPRWSGGGVLKKKQGKTSQYKGVYLNRAVASKGKAKQWRSQYVSGGKTISLGYFSRSGFGTKRS